MDEVCRRDRFPYDQGQKVGLMGLNGACHMCVYLVLNNSHDDGVVFIHDSVSSKPNYFVICVSWKSTSFVHELNLRLDGTCV
jgi:hypothetical protein